MGLRLNPLLESKTMTKETGNHLRDVALAVLFILLACQIDSNLEKNEQLTKLREMPAVEYSIAYKRTSNNTTKIYCYLPDGYMAFNNEVPHLVYLTPHVPVEH